MLRKPPPPTNTASSLEHMNTQWILRRQTSLMSSLYAFWSWSVYTNLPAVLTKNKTRQVRTFLTDHKQFWNDQLFRLSKFTPYFQLWRHQMWRWRKKKWIQSSWGTFEMWWRSWFRHRQWLSPTYWWHNLLHHWCLVELNMPRCVLLGRSIAPDFCWWLRPYRTMKEGNLDG